jgi:hypothetical protein
MGGYAQIYLDHYFPSEVDRILDASGVGGLERRVKRSQVAKQLWKRM